MAIDATALKGENGSNDAVKAIVDDLRAAAPLSAGQAVRYPGEGMLGGGGKAWPWECWSTRSPLRRFARCNRDWRAWQRPINFQFGIAKVQVSVMLPLIGASAHLDA